MGDTNVRCICQELEKGDAALEQAHEDRKRKQRAVEQLKEKLNSEPSNADLDAQLQKASSDLQRAQETEATATSQAQQRHFTVLDRMEVAMEVAMEVSLQ